MRGGSSIVVRFVVVAISLSIIGFCNGNYSGGVSCIESEREALMKFKHNLIDPSNRLASWSITGDCCLWAGVVCDNFTGHVLRIHLPNPYDETYPTATEYEAYESSKLSGKVSSSLLNLRHLKYLDLSENDFGGIQIPKFFGSLKSLRYLNLSHAGFGGKIPYQLGNLSNLRYLDIKMYANHYSYAESFHWLSGLHSLKYLYLKSVDLSNVHDDWLQVTSALPALVELHLSDCQLPNFHFLHNVNFSSLTKLELSSNYFSNPLSFKWVFGLHGLVSLNLRSNNFQGPIPNDFQNLTSLKFLDLSYNNFNSSIPDWLYKFHSLELLNIGYNNLEGRISGAIENLTSLGSLDLSFTKVEGGFLGFLGKLCNLKSVVLSNVTLNQDLSEALENLSGCVSNSLELLDLSYSQIHGQLTDQIAQFLNLIALNLNNNFLSGPIPLSISMLSSLEMLALSNNQFNGSFSKFFGENSKLYELLISNNLLEGEVTETHFENATRLTYLYASKNSLSLKVSSSWTCPFQLLGLELQSWNLGPRFPFWLSSQKYLYAVDISNTKLSDAIPTWFWNMSSQFAFLNISHNHIHGHIPSLIFSNARVIDFNSNNFEGHLPRLSSEVFWLDLSNNLLSGSISQSICAQSNKQSYAMELLYLQGNNLSGKLPDCWDKWKNLIFINLNNKFSGNIPSSMGTLSFLVTLYLRNNKLLGELPESLSNCVNLETIDIGENELVQRIPPWIGKRLLSLKILNLGSNKFYGHIPSEICALASLQILVLANNNLFGAIPRCFSNFRAMVTKSFISELSTFQTAIVESEDLVTKNTWNGYSTILKYVKVLDLSCNKLSGELPVELTTLRAIQSLNLSHNLLTGKIPWNIGAMESLESLDLSVNKLCGEIPPSISALTFLSTLNLSYNNLTGKIPLGTQLQSLNASSFVGNKLCGPPLSKNCNETDHTETSSGKTDSGLKVDWFYASMALGFIVGFWSAVGSLLLNRSWRIIFFQFVDYLWLMFLLFVGKCKNISVF